MILMTKLIFPGPVLSGGNRPTIDGLAHAPVHYTSCDVDSQAAKLHGDPFHPGITSSNTLFMQT